MKRSVSRDCFLPVQDYDLAATLTSGQSFGWRQREEAWEGVIGARWVRLRQEPDGLQAEALEPVEDWGWLREYLQTDLRLDDILRSFPADEPMQAAVAACRGLRLLRQNPWECLASFILSSTKQIVQIQQIIGLLREKYGAAVPVPASHEPVFAFPSPARLAAISESELRACKMGFRAPYLRSAAQIVSGGEMDLAALSRKPCAEAREYLQRLPGVGPKIANCVLLFAYGFPEAFPVDVWVRKALHTLYFPRRRPSSRRMERFVAEYFGPQAGYAQQYLFHYMRVQTRQTTK